jgi:hypothetical protein
LEFSGKYRNKLYKNILKLFVINEYETRLRTEKGKFMFNVLERKLRGICTDQCVSKGFGESKLTKNFDIKPLSWYEIYKG